TNFRPSKDVLRLRGAKRYYLIRDPLSLSPRPQEGLASIGVDRGFEIRRPVVGVNFCPQCLRPHMAIPANLLHGVINLEAVAVGVESVGGVVDTGMELGRDDVGLDADAVLAQEANGVLELAIVCNLE